MAGFPRPAGTPPVVAILRGVRPDELVGVASALHEAGLRMIEVPLNSPDALDSVGRLARAFGDTCLCGAGTVLTPADVDRVRDAGGRLIVTPNTDPAVIRRAVALELAVMPGFATATEAFEALQAGARCLKLFPAATYGPAHLKALRSVLPEDAAVYAVGGVVPATLSAWRAAGAAGVGIGGEFYRPGDAPAEVGRKARTLLAALDEAGFAR